jgi:hypothetical protein
MEIAITLPDDLGAQLAEQWADLPRHALEALAAEAYRQGLLSSAEVQRILGFSSRFEVARFLKRSGVPVDYAEADLEVDRQTWDELHQA